MKIEGTMASEPTAANESRWEVAFWAMGLARHKSVTTTEALHRAFKVFPDRSLSFQRSMLEAVVAVYSGEFLAEMQRVLEFTRNEKLFAMAATHLLRSKAPAPFDLHSRMRQQFPHYASHPILRMLDAELSEMMMDRPPFNPPVVDLLSHQFETGKPVLFSMQRRNRAFPGIALLRDAQGRFVRTEGDSIFHISQLALSASNLPGYLTNGSTPRGILSIQGFATVENTFIGPTETIQMVMPHEAKPFEFFHTTNTADMAWTEERYTQLLPESWQGQWQISEAYFAGEAGRTEIIAHGTTVDAEFYRGEPFYPNTPTLGCLCAVELWSPATGERVASDQQLLVDAMKRIGFEKGFAVIVEVDNEQRAVAIGDVTPLIFEAERRLLHK